MDSALWESDLKNSFHRAESRILGHAGPRTFLKPAHAGYLFNPASFRAATWAGRSAGRSLSWHGRGRGFKSHPVHSSWLRIWTRTATCESRSRDGLIGTTALAIVPRLPGDLARELRVARSSSRSGLTILKAPKPVAAVSGGETWITKSRL